MWSWVMANGVHMTRVFLLCPSLSLPSILLVSGCAGTAAKYPFKANYYQQRFAKLAQTIEQGVTEWFGSGRTLIIIYFQTPCHEQEHILPSIALPSSLLIANLSAEQAFLTPHAFSSQERLKGRTWAGCSSAKHSPGQPRSAAEGKLR